MQSYEGRITIEGLPYYVSFSHIYYDYINVTHIGNSS